MVNPDGFVGVVTLWSPKEKIESRIKSQEVRNKIAVIGQLYSKRGVEFIIRNIFLNPKIRYLIVTGADLTQSGEFLLDFDIEKIKEITGGVIPEKDLELFKERVERIDMRKEENLELRIKSLEFREAFSKKPKEFAENKPKGMDFPAENSVFRIEAETVGEAWIQILRQILRFGHNVPRNWNYGGEERALLNVCSVIKNENIKDPKMWPYFNFGKDCSLTF